MLILLLTSLLYLLSFCAVFILVFKFFPRSFFQTDKDVERPKDAGFVYQVRPLIKLVAQSTQKLPLADYRRRIQKKLAQTAEPNDMTADEFLGLKLVSLILGIGVVLVLGLLFGLERKFLIAGMLLGFFMPNIWLNDLIKNRISSIRRELPNFLDLLTLTVEAGLDFGGALTKIVSISKITPLIHEFQMLLQNIRLGDTRQQALRTLADRLEIPELSSVVFALIQADQLGASLGKTLRVQSEQIRTRRMQQIEELANKAPTKMLLPLMLFILPAVFIMLLGPLVMKMMQGGFGF